MSPYGISAGPFVHVCANARDGRIEREALAIANFIELIL
jgi:hypothetical protein